MTPILATLWFLFCLLVLPRVNTQVLNLNNNACPELEQYHIYAISDQCYQNPDVLSDVPQMAKRHGYQLNTYSVTTEDGYILTVFRIPPNGQEPKENALFIQHGVASDSDPWVDIGNRSLGFYYADLGYEVWLGNFRGTRYSNKTVNGLTVNDPAFWNFTLDTLAQQDLPSQLNFTFEKSKKKILYIGHSMGTTIMLMLASTSPEKVSTWCQSINLLAPVAYLNGVIDIETLKLPVILLIDALDAVGIKGLFYQESVIHNFLTQTCKLIPEVCYDFLNLVAGKTTQFAAKDLILFYGYWPCGTSIFTLKQYLQIANSKKFQYYDYGASLNSQYYGTQNPPIYNLTKITSPISFFYGENDSLYNKKNLDRLFNETGSLNKSKQAICSPDGSNKFDHLDFLYSIDIIALLYKKLTLAMQK